MHLAGSNHSLPVTCFFILNGKSEETPYRGFLMPQSVANLRNLHTSCATHAQCKHLDGTSTLAFSPSFSFGEKCPTLEVNAVLSCITLSYSLPSTSTSVSATL